MLSHHSESFAGPYTRAPVARGVSVKYQRTWAEPRDLSQRVLSSVPDNLRALRTLGSAIVETDGLGAAEYVYQIAFDNHSFHPELPGEIEDVLGKAPHPIEYRIGST